jgi:hypothetical protein
MATKTLNLDIAYNGEVFEILALPTIDVNNLDIAYNGEVYAGLVTAAPPAKRYIAYIPNAILYNDPGKYVYYF